MPIELLLGPEGSGKTSHLLSDFARAIPRGRGMMVVPTEAMAQEIRSSLVTPERTALMGDAVLSWNRFVEKIADARQPVLSPSQVVLFLYRLLADHPLRYFRIRRRSLGIARQFAETILALKRGGIGPRRLSQLLETRGSLKENDHLTLYARYEEERGRRGLIDEGDLPALARHRLATGRTELLAGVTFLSFDAFHAFRPGAIALLAELKKALPRACIRISFPKGSPDSLACALLEKGAARLRALSDAVIAFEPQPRRRPDIQIFSARSPIQEARAHACMIAQASHPAKKAGEASIALSCRGRGPFLGSFCAEAAAFGLISPEEMPAGPMRAPLLHELFSPAVVESWPEEAPIAHYAARCETFIQETEVIRSWNAELSHDDDARLMVSQSFRAVAALQEFLRGITTAAALTEADAIGRDAFVELVVSELEEMGQTLPTPGAFPCRIVPFGAGLARPVHHLFLPQMAEGIIPCPQGERLFFSEADRLSALPDTAIDEIFPTTEESLALEALLFEGLLAKARDRIVITFPLIDDVAAESARSSFLDDLPAATPLPVSTAVISPSGPGWTRRRDERIAIELSRGGIVSGHLEYCGRITSPAARELIRRRFTEFPLSPTRLERYAACPFAFFAEKVLGLCPLEEETPEIAPKDRGTILHTLLERLYRDHFDVFERATRDPTAEKEFEGLLDHLLETVFAAHEELVGRASAALAPQQRAAIRTMARQVVELELTEARGLPAPLIPAACEWAFGTDGTDALAIPIEGEAPALIGGRIDRIDADEKRNRFLIVDYKTGARIESVKADIMNGLHLQLPLYVEAVRRLLFPGALPLGGLLLGVQQGEKRHGFVRKEFNEIHYAVGRAHSAMDDGTWEKALAAALSAAAMFTQQIRDGQFPAEPPEGCPRQCDYEETCRFIERGPH